MNYSGNPRLIKNYGGLVQEIESALSNVRNSAAKESDHQRRVLANDATLSLFALLGSLASASDLYDAWQHRNSDNGKATK